MTDSKIVRLARWLSHDEALAQLGVSERTLRRLVERGGVERRRDGRSMLYRLRRDTGHDAGQIPATPATTPAMPATPATDTGHAESPAVARRALDTGHDTGHAGHVDTGLAGVRYPATPATPATGVDAALGELAASAAAWRELALAGGDGAELDVAHAVIERLLERLERAERLRDQYLAGNGQIERMLRAVEARRDDLEAELEQRRKCGGNSGDLPPH